MPVTITIAIDDVKAKVTLFNHQGQRIFDAYSPIAETRTLHEFPHPLITYNTIVSLINKGLDAHLAENVIAIGFSCDPTISYLWNAVTGEPVYSLSSDKESIDWSFYFDVKELIKQKSGLYLESSPALGRLLWILKNDPIIKKKVDTGKILWGTLGTYLSWKLSNGKIFATDHTLASRSLLYNSLLSDYDPELMDLFSLPATLLPTILPSDSLFGLTEPLHSSQQFPIRGLMSNMAAAFAATNDGDNDTLLLTLQPEMRLSALTGNTIVRGKSPENGVHSYRQKQAIYSLESGIGLYGTVLDWFKEGIRIVDKPEHTGDLASRAHESHNLMILSDKNLSHETITSPGLKMMGITPDTTREDMARSALEAVAYEVRGKSDEMSWLLHKPFMRMKVFTKNQDYLMQMLSNSLHMPVEVITDDPLPLGIAIVTGNSDRLITTDVTFHPQIPRDITDHRYSDWLSANS